VEVLCDGCGGKFNVPEDYTRSKIQCPHCGIMCEVPPQARAEQKTIPPGGAELTAPPPRPKHNPQPFQSSRPTKVDEVGDAEPYSLVGGDLKICPKCKNPMSGDAIDCVTCGYDERVRTKAPKERPPVFRDWENGWSATSRIRVYAVCQIIIVASMVTGLLTDRDPGTTIVAAAIGSLILIFLCGTFERFIIRRTSKGRIQLWKIWRICFVPRPDKEIPLQNYDRIRLGASYGADALDWLFVLSMFCLGIIPGLIWGYFVVLRPRYSASLSGTGGFEEEVLYRGGNLERVEEIGRAVGDATGIGVERY
jgi:hypothetical protein